MGVVAGRGLRCVTLLRLIKSDFFALIMHQAKGMGLINGGGQTWNRYTDRQKDRFTAHTQTKNYYYNIESKKGGETCLNVNNVADLVVGQVRLKANGSALAEITAEHVPRSAAKTLSVTHGDMWPVMEYEKKVKGLNFAGEKKK